MSYLTREEMQDLRHLLSKLMDGRETVGSAQVLGQVGVIQVSSTRMSTDVTVIDEEPAPSPFAAMSSVKRMFIVLEPLPDPVTREMYVMMTREAWEDQQAPAVSTDEAYLLSRLLFESREQIEMWSDVVERQGGKPSSYTRELVRRIDAYRADRGWNPNGFGGETS